MVFHPSTNTFVAGTAQVMLYLSVLAPIFWVPHVQYTPKRVQRLLLILLACSALNSSVGVLQVYDPGHWMPSQLSSVITSDASHEKSLTYVGPDGRRIVRPPGLSDNPGGVAGPAAIAATLGLVLMFGPFKPLTKALCALSAVLGVAAILLSHVRTSLLVAAGSFLVYIAVLAIQRQRFKVILALAIGTSVAIGSFSLALILGGEAVPERFSTLLTDDPISVYYSARGGALDYAFSTYLFQYPLGAGLGRWGMIRYYFGDETNVESPPIWAEIQPTSWILDGGLILLLCYLIALVSTTKDQLKIARFARSSDLRFSAAAIVALSATTLGLIFGFTPFTTQVGLQYWFVSGVLYGAAYGPAA
ncbi:MAG TPA: hypothetical protein VNW97_22255 [Candidatus Saccharimonadales bacterium]|nr:hypothetical protein [Candidatus Saccharimonadales bacterium]